MSTIERIRHCCPWGNRIERWRLGKDLRTVAATACHTGENSPDPAGAVPGQAGPDQVLEDLVVALQELQLLATWGTPARWLQPLDCGKTRSAWFVG